MKDLKILVVDDTSELLHFYANTLSNMGFVVLEANNGEEALDLYKENLNTIPVDVVLTDIMMPGINGLELAEELLKINPDANIMFMSATVDDKNIVNEFSNFPFFLKKVVNLKSSIGDIINYIDNKFMREIN